MKEENERGKCKGKCKGKLESRNLKGETRYKKTLNTYMYEYFD